ncbi:MAG: hypothetical protein ISR65_18055 [Bacteriovoracaceae bacterium]|nr:hypothetical protein [Bacteriovoracaceae bacterium]
MIDFSDAPLYGRIEGLKLVLNKLEKVRPTNVFIIETGTTRGDLGGGPEGDGWATPLFGWYCKKNGGTTWTIDIEEEAISQCREITKEYADQITYFVGDSSEIIQKANVHVDLLYLDSANDPLIALNELKAAEKNITDKTIIYIDDTSMKTKRVGGICKGVLVFNYLFQKGWDVTFDNGHQIIMEKSTSDHRNFFATLFANFKTNRIYKRVLRKGAI